MKTIPMIKKVKFRKPYSTTWGFAISFFFMLIILLPVRVQSQQIDAGQIVLSRLVYCPDLAYTTTMLLQEFHQKENKDTLVALMNNWEANCSMTEPLMRFKLLYMIETNTFCEDWYPENMLEMLEEYREQSRLPDQLDLYLDYRTWEYFQVHPGYTEFTKNLAENLKRFKDLSPLEQYFLEFYSGNFREARKMQQKGVLAGTHYDGLTNAPRRSGFAFPEQIVSLSGGIWQPTGNLKSVGASPEFGISYGVLVNNFFLNGFGSLSLGNSTHTFMVKHLNSSLESAYTRGWGMGFEMGYEVIKTRNASIVTTAGYALRGFKSRFLDEQDSRGLPGAFGSASAHLGLNIRRNFLVDGHIGLQMRYNFVNFENIGGTDLSGNLITMGLIVGLNY
jgi:hypothetical protein